jgi:hypothetical protein
VLPCFVCLTRLAKRRLQSVNQNQTRLGLPSEDLVYPYQALPVRDVRFPFLREIGTISPRSKYYRAVIYNKIWSTVIMRFPNGMLFSGATAIDSGNHPVR